MFTNDSKDGLPSYSEVFASAPLLEETYSSSIFAGATILRLEYESSDSLGIHIVHFTPQTTEWTYSPENIFPGYSFLIRNSLGSLQARGVVDRLSNTRLQNVNGTEMMKITKPNRANDVNDAVFVTIRHSFSQ